MKKITFLTLLCILTLSSIAQNKFGYIDSSELLSVMPEKKTAETELQNFAKSSVIFLALKLGQNLLLFWMTMIQ